MKSRITRVPDELFWRVEEYRKKLGKEGVVVSRVDAMRLFAENAILPQDDVRKALEILGRQKFKIKL